MIKFEIARVGTYITRFWNKKNQYNNSTVSDLKANLT